VSSNEKDKELRDVMREEKSRGRRRVDSEEEAKRKRLELGVLKAIAEEDVEAYVRMLHEAGLKAGTPEYQNALKVFYASLRKR
jgi:hypothetical protein